MEHVIRHISKSINSDIISVRSIGGGCVASTHKVQFENGLVCFLKMGLSKEMCQAEADGLDELARAKALRIPKVLDKGDDFLLLEYIFSAHNSDKSYVKLGKGLAMLHQFHNTSFGLSYDNYIGSTPQKNIANEDEASNWCTFYVNKRLLPQYHLALANGYVDHKFSLMFEKLIDNATAILSSDDALPVLLHGDLWSGNYMSDDQDNACLFDPAVYYGHREADLAMTYLFGGFPRSFYDAYHYWYPLANDWSNRLNIYKLYHVLNHLNMFGLVYRGEALDLIRYYI